MPVTYGSFTKQLKLLPLTLYPDGRASVTVRFGFVAEGGDFEASTEQTFYIEADQVSLILDTQPVPGLTRRDDLSLAVYMYLVANGLVAPGEIN